MTLIEASRGSVFQNRLTTKERRRSPRTLTIYRLVQVEYEDDEGLARCRNISDTGMKLDLKMPIAVNGEVRVSFSPTFVIPGKVIWLEGKECGVEFAGRIDCTDLLKKSAIETRSDRSREPRLKANLPAKVFVDGHTQSTVISDISQHGMKITHDGRLQPGLRVRVTLECGAEKTAVVRWTRGRLAGLFLWEPFSVDDLGSVRSL